MRETQNQDCDRYQAALPEAVLDSITSDEGRDALEHTATCGRCHDALTQSAALDARILLSDIDMEVEVPASIKRGLMEKIKSVPQQNPGIRSRHDGLLILRSASVPWQETDLPGMQWRPFSSPLHDSRTMAMYRLDAGVTVPGHRHEGVEELYMLSGTLLVEGVPMNAGDYCLAEFGTMHAPVTALTNCEFLLSSDNVTYF